MTNITITNSNNNVRFDIVCYADRALCSMPFELAMIAPNGDITVIKQSDNLSKLFVLANSLNSVAADYTDEEVAPMVETLQVLYGI